ncbi:MAG: 3-deoxy-D-manno-octulosonic acid transferase [Legionellales bacterium]|nr:3-deoxy-D-manno-octulosonic acid transferase [Legionellales bacterium]
MDTSCYKFWVHAVSVGEVVAASAIIDRCLAQYPDDKIIITVMTPTGRQRAHDLYADNDAVICAYLPYDIRFAIMKFLRHFNPKILIIMETEIWPTLLQVVSEKNIAIMLANARLSARSCRSYARVRVFSRQVLSHISCIAAQSKQDAKRFAFLQGGAQKNIVILGSVKYDLALKQLGAISPISPITAIKGEKTFIAVSTHPGEEEQIFLAFKNIKVKHVKARLILAPRHSYRAESLMKMSGASYGFRSELYSKLSSNNTEYDVILVDKMGVISSLLNMANVVFVGGSLVAKGGQNPLEPAAHSLPIIMGPSRYNFNAVTCSMAGDGGLFLVESAADITLLVNDFFENPQQAKLAGEAAYNNVMKYLGATDRHMHYIKELVQK